MIKKRFFIEGNEMDLGDGIEFPLNFQCSNVASLENIINNYTYSVKLPKTENNLSIIEHIQEVSNTSAYQCYYHDCTYFIDEIPLFDAYGRVRILRITDTIEVTVLFGNFTMFENLKLKKLKEGGNSASMNDVLLWDYGLNENSSGYSGFGLGQFGNTIDSYHNLYAQRVLPWVSAKFLWDMCLDSNYNLNSEISTFLDTLILPLTSKNSELQYLDDVDVIMYTYNMMLFTHGTYGTVIKRIIELSTSITDTYRLYYNLDMGGGIYRGVFIIPVSGNYKISFYTYLSINTEPISGVLEIIDENSDSVLYTINWSNADNNTTINENLRLNSEDRIYVKFIVSLSSGSLYDIELSTMSFTIKLDTDNADNKFDTTAFKLKYPINNNLPDVSQSDYIKSIMQLFGLMVQPIDGVFCFFSFNDVYDNLSKALDWSDNLVLASKHETFIDFASDTGMDLAMANYLRYKPDADITDQYGDDYLSSSNQFIPFRDILINQIFSASHGTQFTDNSNDPFNVIQADLFKYDKDNWVADKKINQRICIKNKYGVDLKMASVFGEPVVNSSGDGIDSVVERSLFRFLDHDNGLDYTSLKYNYWNKYEDIILNYKQVRLKFILTPLQLREFRFDYPIYLKQYGRYFFVKKINNWDVNKITEIDLIVL